jgi:hypothetical protein
VLSLSCAVVCSVWLTLQPACMVAEHSFTPLTFTHISLHSSQVIHICWCSGSDMHALVNSMCIGMPMH